MRMACGCYRPFCRWWVAPNTLLSWELPDFSGVGVFSCVKRRDAAMVFFEGFFFVVGLENIIKNPMFLQRWESKNLFFFTKKHM